MLIERVGEALKWRKNKQGLVLKSQLYRFLTKWAWSSSWWKALQCPCLWNGRECNLRGCGGNFELCSLVGTRYMFHESIRHGGSAVYT